MSDMDLLLEVLFSGVSWNKMKIDTSNASACRQTYMLEQFHVQCAALSFRSAELFC